MIDLARFAGKKIGVVPLVGGWGKLNGRMIWKEVEDGWYRVEIGNSVDILGKATPMDVERALVSEKTCRVYPFGEDGVPTNFDNFRKMGIDDVPRINFLSAPIFEVAKIVIWEDGRPYYYETDFRYERALLKALKDRDEAGKSIADIKGVTPELAYYFLLINLGRQTYRRIDAIMQMNLSESEKEKRAEQFKNTFEERLKETIEAAGGTMKSVKKASGSTWLVVWTIGDQTVKTTMKDNFAVSSAGFCLSGDDKFHSVASLVQLAKMFKKVGPLYITRQ